MDLKRIATACLTMLALGQGAWAQPRRGGEAIDDAWLGEQAVAEVEALLADGDMRSLGELHDRLGAVLVARAACGPIDRPETLCDLAYAYRASKYLPLAADVGKDARLDAWLAKHRPVAEVLYRALGDVDKPAKALGRLVELVEAEPQAVAEYPDLAAAFATSDPLTHYRKQPEPAGLVDSFRYYTKSKVRFRYDLRKLPYELLRYLADTRLSLAERQWAVSRYASKRTPAKAYFDLDYDFDHYREGKPKKIAKLDYTLPNLRKVGGVCIEQAYYAAEVCKALGIPATIVYGRGGGGTFHAWLAHIQVARGGQRSEWDVSTGRYESQLYYKGWVRDPAREKLLDSELMLYSAATTLPHDRKVQAEMALEIAGLCDKALVAKKTADVGALRALARAATERRAGDGEGKPVERSVEWIDDEAVLDRGAVEGLIALSIDRNLAYRPAWEMIVELRKGDRLAVDRLDRFFDTLVSRTAKAYPDFSYDAVMRIVPTIDEPEKREKVYQRAHGVYARRPDLQGGILLALGEDYEKRRKRDKALRVFREAAFRSVRIAEVVVPAARKAEDLYSLANRLDLAVEMYKDLWGECRKPGSDARFARYTSWFQIGQRLAFVLDITDRRDDAAKVRDVLGIRD
jgi:hypothetical protein